MKKTPLARRSKSETAKAKDRIQAKVREIVILRDGGCWLRGKQMEFGPCDGPLQADHLETRSKNISYAVTDLIVCACRRHHYYHGHPVKRWRDRYEELARKFIGEKRATLWDRVRMDGKAHPMSAWDWAKVEIALEQELENLRRT